MSGSQRGCTDCQAIGVLFHLVIGLCAELAERDPERVDRIRAILAALPVDRLSAEQRGDIASALEVLDRLPAGARSDRQRDDVIAW